MLFVALLAFSTANAQLLEDFEGGTADLPWVGINGTYNGVIANPDKSGINTSDFVGSYTNSPTFDFNFSIADQTSSFDLSKNNLVRMKVWSPIAPITVLFKFEGGGQAAEKAVTLTTANQWTEMEFDVSTGVNKTLMNKVLVSFNSFVLGSSETFYWDDIQLVKNERVVEDFEGGPDLNWININGQYLGAIANPAPNSVNSSATVGQFVNGSGDFSFPLGTTSDTLNLTRYNQFSVQLWAPRPTEFLFKLEGSGQQLEVRRNIAVANEWQEYYFDMSGTKDFNTITKVLVIYSPGITGQPDTFYVDNIKAYPDNCPDTAPDPEMIDDFECNRNAVYGVGWDSVQVVANPGKDAGNTSACVGKWNRRTGPGTEYAALVISYELPIDLSQRNQFGLKVWASKAGTMLLKIEGGTGQKEVGVPITADQVGKWVEISADFSDQVGKGHTRLVLFFDAGQNGVPGDTYFFDDVRLFQRSSLAPIETFQNGNTLFWQPLDGNNTVHGTFTSPTDNPASGGINTSTQVGCYSKGSGALSTLQAFLPGPLNLNGYPQLELDVYSAAGSGEVVMQLASATQGTKEATAEYTGAGAWQTLKFNFEAFDDIADFGEIRIQFDPGTAAAGESWCIDNLRQSVVTVDPCANTVPNPQMVDDFECQRNYDNIFYGGSDLAVIDNPQVKVENPSLKVGEYKDPAGPSTEYAGIGFQFAAPVDLTTYNQLEFLVYSPVANIPVLIKLEGGTQIERFDTITEANKWTKLRVDFSSAAGAGNTKLVIFFEPGTVDGGETYLIDNIRFGRPNYTGCFINYEKPETTIDNFLYFNQDPAVTEEFTVVDNPDPDMVNMSSKVGKFIQGANAPKFTGMYADLESFIDFRTVKEMRVKVHMDHIGTFTLKTEIFGNNPPPVEITVPNTKVNDWEELVFNFSAAPDQPVYPRFTILVDLGTEAPGTNRVTYFDDIVIGAGTCATSSVFDLVNVAALQIAPNPVTDVVRVTNFTDIARFDVVNAFGQRLLSTEAIGLTRSEIQVAALPAGVYFLTAYNNQGALVGNGRFVKQ